MKGWAMVVASVTLSVMLGNTLYAAEPDVQIYEELNNVEFHDEFVNDGRLVINFTTNEEDVFDGYNSSPVSNIKVSLTYLYNGVMTDVRGLEEFARTNLSLVSDENGKIVLENLPYGYYQYNVIEVPQGYKLDQEIYEVEITIMDVMVNRYNLVETELVLDTSTYEPVISEKEDEVVYVEQVIKPVEEVQVEKAETSVVYTPVVKEETTTIPKENVSVQKVNLNTLAENIEENESGEETVKRIIDYTREIASRRKVDMYTESRQYSTRDTLRVAITQVDSSVLKIADLAGRPGIDKNKKNKFRNNGLNWKILENNEEDKFLVAKLKVSRRAV